MVATICNRDLRRLMKSVIAIRRLLDFEKGRMEVIDYKIARLQSKIRDELERNGI